MRYKQLTLIGTSHIAKQSVQEVECAILEKKPGIVAVELDARRFYALMHSKKSKVTVKDVLSVGIKGYLFSVIGAYVQKKFGRMVGIEPGAEMKKAINTARKIGAKIALVDQDIEITLRRFSEKLSWKERFRFVYDIFAALLFKEREIEKLGLKDFDLTKVPEDKLVQKLTSRLKQRYPNVHLVLVEERNKVMAKNLASIMQQNPDTEIIAVVGAGHEKELLNLIRQQH